MFPPKEFWIIVSERDCSVVDAEKFGHLTDGPLVHESYCSRWRTREQAHAALKSMGNRYGRAVAILIQPEGLAVMGACSFENCDQSGTVLACGREEKNSKPAIYCDAHAKAVTEEGSPEYTPGCPNCNCIFGVN